MGSKRSLGGEAGCGLADCLEGAILSDGNASRPILSIGKARLADGNDEEEDEVTFPLRISLLPLAASKVWRSSGALSTLFLVCNASNAPFVV